jgi:hypothetical protein
MVGPADLVMSPGGCRQRWGTLSRAPWGLKVAGERTNNSLETACRLEHVTSLEPGLLTH